MLISFVILNYNGKELSLRCLSSLIESLTEIKGFEYEFIFVDNGSFDDSVEAIQEQFPFVKIVEIGFNKFTMSYNEGVRAASGEWICLLNNDITFEKGFLEPLLDHINDPEIFAIGSVLVKEDGDLDSASNIPHFHHGMLKFDIKELIGLSFSFYIGAHGIFRRQMFLELGGFDELFSPFFWEDTDLCYRAWKNGWKTVIDSRSKMIHKHQATIGKFFDKKFVTKVYIRNTYIFFWKNIVDWRLKTIHFLFLPLHLLSQILRQRQFYSSAAFFQAIALYFKNKNFFLHQNEKYSDNFIIDLIKNQKNNLS